MVFISGFMTPQSWLSYPSEAIPSHIRMIPVFPSPVGSLHDRVCRVFYEIKGGQIDYGKQHSTFHGHDQHGEHLPGKYPQWDEQHPIYLIGHSFGGLTGWVLQNYLAQDKFQCGTSAKWIKGLVTVNTPFNGALQTYMRGLHLSHPPIVQWASQGYIIGFLVHLSEFVGWKSFKNVFDFGQGTFLAARLCCVRCVGARLRIMVSAFPPSACSQY